ncbi:DnaJ domain-containing protein, partial [Myxococcota bacterium]
DELDEEAQRTRILARKALVEHGDYFAVLGVPHSATAYDIRRAYLELKRELEPARALTRNTADLRDDLDLILEVVDEAYEILRDHTRRERYRRAITAAPE